MDYNITYDYLRPKKAAALKEMHAHPFPCRESLRAERYPNATVLPMKDFGDTELAFGRGGVLDQEGTYIQDSSLDSLFDYGYECTEAPFQDSTAVYCGYFERHWGHFLVYTLPRLWYFLESDHPDYRYVFITKPGDHPALSGNYQEFFRLLGLENRIDILTQPVKYAAVIVPEPSYNQRNAYHSPEYKRLFDTVADAALRNSVTLPRLEKRIFLSRSQLTKGIRMEAGLDFLDHYFEKNGFQIIYPEKVSLSQMIHLIRNAEIVAAPSGTLPHNMLFGSDGQQLIIVERNALNNEFQADIDRVRQLRTTYIDGNLGVYPVELSYGPFIFGYNNRFEDFTRDHGYQPPVESYRNRRYYKRLLQQFFRTYQDEHRYQWYMDDWMHRYSDILYEAYKESLPYFGEFLRGSRPFLLHHYFTFHYFKQFIKRLIGRS